MSGGLRTILWKKSNTTNGTLKGIWDLLTGQYLYTFAPFIGLGIGAGMYNNYNKKQENGKYR